MSSLYLVTMLKDLQTKQKPNTPKGKSILVDLPADVDRKFMKIAKRRGVKRAPLARMILVEAIRQAL